ncbi:DUF2935 domain-containing protein [Paucisalibacillus sp. EB02]|uniref:DUF2935 domain-containing protein n=1 Tax=Paucisalibacillus sp. EB02 TaxID=1347087 RepID=UPI0004ACB06B|nr:DUF2935 domain-containing protein [Paucisalibacillus sp. EB02]
MKDYLSSVSFEHRFWLRVLRDHAQFIHDSLYPSEERDISKARDFMETFEELLEETDYLSNNNVIAFTKKAETATENLREFKLSIIRRQLNGQIGIHLSPTFLNHMVNELEEYVLIIGYLKEGKPAPIFHELHHHLIWLADASGHAGAIHDELDGVEKRLKERSQKFVKHFDQFYLKAIELTGYLRANISSFPALKRFNNDVEVEMNLFRTFLHEIEEMELSDTVLSTFSALMADHMYREECYYLTKLAESTKSTPPNCDPT